MTTDKKILNRFYLIVVLLLIFSMAVGAKMLNIQFVNDEKYEALAEKRVFKNFTIPANRGNIYDANGNLLATSVPKYDIRFDAVTVSQEDFDANLRPLADSLSKLLGNSSTYYVRRLRHARKSGNRYLFIARNLGYADYIKIKNFPLFEKGPYKGGIITEQSTVREQPLGKIAERTVGHNNAGLEGAYNEYLEGDDGHRLKQKIANGLWKPISDANEIDPQDGLDVISTIDVNIQDIVHHALLRQLEKYEADHGTAVVMEVATGQIKGMANLGRTSDGKYYEKRNYAIWQAQEPGSTFKLMSIVAALEDRVVDTATIFDSEGGTVRYYDRIVRDSHRGGYGKISAARAFEVSSNTVFSKIITEGYKDNPEAFINRLEYMGLGDKLGLEIKGEGQPIIPHPGDKNWYGTTLPWMSFGYGILLTPLQTLNFYNAIANDGIAVKPRLIKEIRDGNLVVKSFTKPQTHSICSRETALIAQALMKHTVERGTASGIALDKLDLAGKTGTAVASYNTQGRTEYTASFAGFFPADNPKYSCIIVVNNPNTRIGFYGSQVAAPAFQEIAKKIFVRTPQLDTIKSIEIEHKPFVEDYNDYYALSDKYKTIMPNVIGLPAMDAVALLENMGLKPHFSGAGIVTHQSISKGKHIRKGEKISLRTR